MSRDRITALQPGDTARLGLKNKQTKKPNWVWWLMPVIPATLEAKAGESLEPGRRRLRGNEIRPLHFSLGNKRESPFEEKKRIFTSVFIKNIGL